MKNKFLLILIIFGVGLGITAGLVISHGNQQKGQVLVQQAPKNSQIPTVNPTPSPGIPEEISIPKINVNAVVESVGMDSQGRMDVPKNAIDTAWYSPGFKPGIKGSAVIDGHYDRVTGAPAVFWNLKLLSTGDMITVTDNNGKKYMFSVIQVAKYPDDNFPLKEVFAEANVPMLNLITCNGVWDKVAKNYSNRLVVYSRLIAIN
jgi:sortase A